jgi:hypothetical protein
MHSFYKKLAVVLDNDTIIKLNDFIDNSCHRNSLIKAYGAHDFLRRTYGETYFQNYPERKAGGPGKNEACFIKIPSEIIKESTLAPVINYMAPRYLVEPFIFKMPPNYYLSWHKDSVRTVGINIPIDNLDDSFTIFSQDNVDDDSTLVTKKSMYVSTVPYEKGGLYLLDVSRYHCVFNLSNKNRFIIIAMWDSHQDKFNDVFNHLKNGNFV